ncbi:MAG: prolyl oligopeptidase family serine peptidase [Salinibacter sp.]
MRRLYRPLLVLLTVGLGVFAPEVQAQETENPDSLTVEHYLNWERVSNPRISPDGSQIVYTRSHVNTKKDSWSSEIWIMNADGSQNRFLVEGSSPRWSPDGTRIAYLAEGKESKGSQIFVKWLGEDGGPTQVTRLEESPRNIKWGPDGERIAFLKHVPDVKDWAVDIPSPPEGAQWTESPRVVNRIHYRADGMGWMDEGYTHLFTVPATGGTARQLTSGDWNVGARFDNLPYGGDYEWTPDGSHIVFDGYGWKKGIPDRNYRTSHLYAIEVESKDIRRLTSETGTWSNPEIGPEGRRVAFTGHAETDLTYKAPSLWSIPLNGGEKKKLSGNLDRQIQDLTWRPDGTGLYVAVPNEGAQNIWFAPADGQGPRQITKGDHMLGLSSLSSNGVAVGGWSKAQRPEDLVRYRPRAFDGVQQLTHVNRDVLRDVRLGNVEEIWYESTDNTRVQGWIVKPPSFDPSKDYPMVLFIHGGPHAMYDVGFSWIFQNLAANGFVVLYTNPRGSTGYGTDFAAAISQDYPSVDHEDLMTGVDSLVNRGYVDTSRQFVTGCSGGGVLSSWAIGHTDRFEAAAVLCPVTNWISMAGTTDIPYFTYNFFEEPFWENPSPWLKHSSLMYADEVDTPTLLATGKKDLRTPMPQTEEFYQALKRRGVNTVMLRFNEEYHGIWSQPSNFMRAQRYIIEWFENKGHIKGLTVEGNSENGDD